MLIIFAQALLAASLATVVLQHLGVPILQRLYPEGYGPEMGYIAAYLLAAISAVAVVSLRRQRSRRRRTRMGFTFPSELHAEWSIHLDDLGIPWRYHNEPLCAGRHHMQITIGEQTLCAVVMNRSQLSDRIANQVSASGCNNPKAILGNYPKDRKGAVGWFQTDRNEPWTPIPID